MTERKHRRKHECHSHHERCGCSVETRVTALETAQKEIAMTVDQTKAIVATLQAQAADIAAKVKALQDVIAGGGFPPGVSQADFDAISQNLVELQTSLDAVAKDAAPR